MYFHVQTIAHGVSAAIYHVTAPGNARMQVLEEDADQVAFPHLIEEALECFKGLCSAYTLMGNHYHLILESVEGNLSL